jgi:hypothetical protein
MKDLINKNKILCLLIVVGVFSFYWYSYRPYVVSKGCIQTALENAKGVDGDQTDARYFFWKCEKQHGIGQ